LRDVLVSGGLKVAEMDWIETQVPTPQRGLESRDPE